MSGYTPGPWSYYTTPQPNGCPVIGSSKGLMVAMLSHSVNEESQSATAFANARLIAAAPDLLMCLKECVENLETTLRWREGWECSDDELLGDARAAIRKATEAAS